MQVQTLGLQTCSDAPPVASVSDGLEVEMPFTELPEDQAPGLYPESDSTPPVRDRHSGTLSDGKICRTRDEGYEVCFERPSGGVYSIQLTSSDRERPDENRKRYWEFVRSEDARQELELQITDASDDRTSSYQESYIRFFPRRVLPSIRRFGDSLSVTLPTGEKVRFDADTKRVVGGVLAETDFITGKPAGVEYRGSGVILRSDRRGNDPRSGGHSAVISKPECRSGETCKPCKVPVTQLWTRNADNPVFKFPSDEGFDAFVRQTCGFSIY